MPNPHLEDQGVTLCLVSTLRPVRHGWPYQEYKTPADIALGVIETHKPLHHDKVVTPFGLGWFLWREENWRTQRKTLGARQEKITNSTHLWHWARIEPGLHWWEESPVTKAPSQLP